MTRWDCWDCRELHIYPDGVVRWNSVREFRTRLGRLLHGLIRHRVWSTSRYWESRYWEQEDAMREKSS